ncbi:hypothetical protein GPECTOR_3g477 [Gonium pectorale]|uniref:Uncharacterized protein n=1 Tax=Gonium pectorale TaxID=33097 RepID=A0A150GZK4_GONPE|nr:hypothetical protein GPECTOR_3g477 [Gonium pectorale]|eukprot:KXZ55346.1 hypothetical protein GPECTOR_3g477 [Gonium pectorale]
MATLAARPTRGWDIGGVGGGDAAPAAAPAAATDPRVAVAGSGGQADARGRAEALLSGCKAALAALDSGLLVAYQVLLVVFGCWVLLSWKDVALSRYLAASHSTQQGRQDLERILTPLNSPSKAMAAAASGELSLAAAAALLPQVAAAGAASRRRQGDAAGSGGGGGGGGGDGNGVHAHAGSGGPGGPAAGGAPGPAHSNGAGHGGAGGGGGLGGGREGTVSRVDAVRLLRQQLMLSLGPWLHAHNATLSIE